MRFKYPPSCTPTCFKYIFILSTHKKLQNMDGGLELMEKKEKYTKIYFPSLIFERKRKKIKIELDSR